MVKLTKMIFEEKSFLICLMATILATISGQQYEYKCEILRERNQTLCDAKQQDFNITLEFERMSQRLNGTEQIIQSLIIQNTSIEELPENAFLDLAFESIEILGAKQLSRINAKAFSDKIVTHLIHQLMIENPSSLESKPPKYDLFKALNSLKNIALIEISLKESIFHEIPDYAFNESQNNLKYLSFDAFNVGQNRGYGLTKIGSNSFIGLSKVTSISFRNIVIQELSSDAFKINDKSNEKLFINLENCMLLDSSFGNDSFVGANRPVTVNLALNSIDYIREEKFGKFLSENKENKLEFYGNIMNCEEIDSFLWILNNKEEYVTRIIGALCYDGTSFWDLAKSGTAPSTIPSLALLSLMLSIPIFIFTLHQSQYN